MADVVNSMGSSPNRRSNASYTTSPCSSNSAMVSPSIVEAIDRIFPKSPSQLLQHPFSDSISSKKAPAESILPSSSNTISTLPCTVSMANLTTHTTTTATAVFTGLSTSSGTKSPVMSSIPTSYMDFPSVPAQTKFNHVSHKNGTVDLSLKKTSVSSKRISRADLEIMNNLSADHFVRNGRSGRESNSSEKGLSDSQSIELSDSDDMTRPFSNVPKKKKKKKISKLSEHRKEPYLENTDSTSTTDSTSADSQRHVLNIPKLTILQSSTLNSSSANDTFLQKTKIHGSLENVSYPTLNDSKVSSEQEKSVSSPHISSPESIIRASQDSNPERKHRKQANRQKLPKSKRCRYHIRKHHKHIRKTFLPCFVVLKKVDNLAIEKNNVDQILPLHERVRILSSLCAQNKIECASQRQTMNDLLNFRHYDYPTGIDSEDDFKIPHGRSLRKRRSDICYAEPTEDDLLEDVTSVYSKKESLQSKNSNEKDSILKDDTEHPKKKIKLQPPPDGEKKNKSLLGSGESQRSVISDLSSLLEAKLTNSQSQLTRFGDIIHRSSSDLTGKDRSMGGPSLVYVYPKTSVLTSAQTNCVINVTASQSCATKTSSTAIKDKSTKSPSASKTNTNRLLNAVSVAPVTTLTLPVGVKNLSASTSVLGLTGTTMAAVSSSAQNLPVVATTTSLSSISQKSGLPTNLCMVKIDGKDFLVSVPPNNNIRAQLNSPNSMAIPVSHSNLVSVAGPRSLLYLPSSGIRPTILPPTNLGLTSSFTIPHQSPTITLPSRITTPSATYLLSPAVPQNSSMSSAPPIGRLQSVTTMPNIVASPIQSLLSSSPLINQTIISVPTVPSVTTTTTSADVSSSLRTASAVITTSGVMQVNSSVARVSAPGAISVHQRPTVSCTSSSSTVQLVAPNTSATGTRCFRIIVPACSATGSSARIATLGASALSSPLTRLTASSTLLPQRKQSFDKDMSPEKRAARRRKLEKKYPLPPGVVIKTESLDNPTQTATVTQAGTVRSLLSGQNIQLIAASSRSVVGGVQRFRIISPGGSGLTVGSRPVRLGSNSNIIIRAPVISSQSSRPSSSSSLLIPISASSALSLTSVSSSITYCTANNIVSTTTVSASVSCSSSMSSANSDLETSSATSTATVNTLMTSSPSGTISLLSSSSLFTSSGTTSSPVLNGSRALTSSTVTGSLLASSRSGESLVVSASKGSTVPTSSNERDTSTPESTTSISAQNSNKSVDISGTGIIDIESVRKSVENLRKLVSRQEVLGLVGPRLDKLKEVLSQKEIALSELEKKLEESETNEDSDTSLGCTAEDPVVID